MNENVASSLKSADTEDWLDYHVVRPFSYLWARMFAKLGVHPNAVTIMSMIIGAVSCLFFAHGCLHYEGGKGLLFNLIGIALLVLADVFDCADGQLARLTGKKSRLGRILDGLAGFAWYIPIYAALVYRFYVHHGIEFGWLGIADTEQNALIATAVVFVIALVSGICLANQQRLADYYIQAHLFFLKGEKGSELDNSAKQEELYKQMDKSVSFAERLFQRNYVSYTKLQERITPQFQRLVTLLGERYGTADQIPQEVRDRFREKSLPVLKYNGMLTFNFRSSYLFLFCLLDVPVLAFLFEIIGMTLLKCYVNRRHERFCRELADSLQ